MRGRRRPDAGRVLLPHPLLAAEPKEIELGKRVHVGSWHIQGVEHLAQLRLIETILVELIGVLYTLVPGSSPTLIAASPLLSLGNALDGLTAIEHTPGTACEQPSPEEARLLHLAADHSKRLLKQLKAHDVAIRTHNAKGESEMRANMLRSLKEIKEDLCLQIT